MYVSNEANHATGPHPFEANDDARTLRPVPQPALLRLSVGLASIPRMSPWGRRAGSKPPSSSTPRRRQPKEMIVQILMVRGVPVQLSDEDFEWASRWRWVWRGPARHKRVSRVTGPSRCSLHGALWARMGRSVPPGLQIDHKDRDHRNNQRDNLRLLTPSANSANRAAKGYYWNKPDKRWLAQIKKDGVKHHLGCFKSEEEAAAAYEAGKRRFFPELYED